MSRPRSGPWVLLILIGLAMMGSAGAAYYVKTRSSADAITYTLATPETVAGLKRSQKPELKQQADSLETQLRGDMPDATDVVAVFYADPAAAARLTLIGGAAGPVDNPSAEIDDIFASLGQGGITATEIHDVAVGAAGGKARCGKAEANGAPLVVCGWADGGGAAALIFFNHEPNVGDALLPKIIPAIFVRT